MSRFSFLASFARLSITGPTQSNIRTITSYKPLLFKTTPCLCAEPLKKKKKMDQNIIKSREARYKRKLEKHIRKLEKNTRQLKPLEENEVPLEYLQNQKERTRPQVAITPEEVEYTDLLQKEWARYKKNQFMNNVQTIDRIMASQNRALEALKRESEELYEAAIQLDPSIVPCETKGTVSTPPSHEYISPDGEYIDISRKWEN
ncbi:mitochondrial ribosomal protein L40 [Arctopsyche grandis]|uniref:mitochondrial ribosomal protein L40 n=1 Tax=Arctopsyche grandis TaxID=121162 RepID=UPI00406DA4B8